jgi:serine/threonine protein phosphatase 1
LIYVTSDLHGYPLDRFLALLEKAGFDGKDELYILGDVIDRNGDGGIRMLQWIMSMPNVHMLMGNHEAMLLSCGFLFGEVTEQSTAALRSNEMENLALWMRNGAEPTIHSLSELHRRDPQALNDLLTELRELPLYATVNAGGRDFLLVHAGLGRFAPDKKMREYEPNDFLWCRPSVQDRYFTNVMTVLGHTPTGYLFGEPGKMFRTETWMDIDTGAAGGGNPMLLRLDDLKEFYV